MSFRKNFALLQRARYVPARGKRFLEATLLVFFKATLIPLAYWAKLGLPGLESKLCGIGNFRNPFLQ